jgi:hypothetical protein
MADGCGSTEAGASPSMPRRQFRAGTGGVLARGERWPWRHALRRGLQGRLPAASGSVRGMRRAVLPREEVRRPAPASVARGGTGPSG